MDSMIERRREGPVLTLALNRPDIHNAFNPALVAELTSAFREASETPGVRVVVLTGNGRSFCAGADVTAMRAAADYTFEQNVADAHAIFDLMLAVDNCSRPVVGRVNGAAIGGGVGLVACCDIVVVAEGATFGFSESRLGIVPAVISPFVVGKIGPAHARELFLTGERFDARRAREIGLVQHVVAPDALDASVAERVSQLLMAAPGAQEAAKALIRLVAHQPQEAMREATAELIARRRASDEGRDGMSAFLEKRKPSWVPDGVS